MPKRKRVEARPDQPEKKASTQSNLKLDGSITKRDETTPNDVTHFQIPSKSKDINCERRGRDEKPQLIWTHGAGGGLSNAATKDFAEGFAEMSSVISFQGSMNLTGRVRSFETILEHENVKCALGGRSMGKQYLWHSPLRTTINY